MSVIIAIILIARISNRAKKKGKRKGRIVQKIENCNKY